MIGCFFGRKPPPEIEFLLRVLDCSDLFDLAALYGEARDRFQSPSLMQAVNKRMEEVAKTTRATGCPDTMDDTAQYAVDQKAAAEEKSPPATGPAG